METFQGSDLAKRLEAVIHEGNVRRIIVKHEGRTVAEFPVTVGVAAALLAAPVVAVGALAALLTDSTIEVERDEEAPRT
jgi:hypothetical protein